MKAGDEFTIKGKTYVVLEGEVMVRRMLGILPNRNQDFCDYCRSLCQLVYPFCIRKLYYWECKSRLPPCREDDFYFMLKPE